LASVVCLFDKSKNVGTSFLPVWVKNSLGYVLFGEHFFPCFIYRGNTAGLVIENHGETLEELKDGVICVQVLKA